MIALALALALQVAAPSPAGAVPPVLAGQAMTPQQRLAQIGTALRMHGMSADGVRKVQADLVATNQILHGFGPRVIASINSAHAAAFATPFVPAQFEQAIRVQAGLTADVQRTQADRQIALFRSLSPGDQRVYAQMITPALPAGAGARR